MAGGETRLSLHLRRFILSLKSLINPSIAFFQMHRNKNTPGVITVIVSTVITWENSETNTGTTPETAFHTLRGTFHTSRCLSGCDYD